MADPIHEILFTTKVLEIHAAPTIVELDLSDKILEVQTSPNGVEVNPNEYVVTLLNADDSVCLTVEKPIHEIHPPGEYTRILQLLEALKTIEYRKLNGNRHQIWFDTEPPPPGVTGIWFRQDEDLNIIDIFANAGDQGNLL